MNYRVYRSRRWLRHHGIALGQIIALVLTAFTAYSSYLAVLATRDQYLASQPQQLPTFPIAANFSNSQSWDSPNMQVLGFRTVSVFVSTIMNVSRSAYDNFTSHIGRLWLYLNIFSVEQNFRGQSRNVNTNNAVVQVNSTGALFCYKNYGCPRDMADAVFQVRSTFYTEGTTMLLELSCSTFPACGAVAGFMTVILYR